MRTKEKSISNEVCCHVRSGIFTAARREYSPLSISSISIEIDSAILIGSVMDQKIKVNNVTVTEYEDGFAGITDESQWTITFE